MNEEDKITKALREVGPRYITNSQQELVGFLLTPEEYDDYLNMRLRSESSSSARSGVPGKKLLRFAGAIPLADLQLMQQAIEVGCEVIDSNEW